jgi:hypothetical protein
MTYIKETLLVGHLLGIKGSDDEIMYKIEGLRLN